MGADALAGFGTLSSGTCFFVVCGHNSVKNVSHYSFGYVYVIGTHNGGYGVFNLSKVKGGG